MPPTDSLGLCIVDDHALLRQGLTALISDEEDLRLIGEAATAEEGLALVRKQAGPTDVLILDLSLPDGSGLEVLKTLRREGIEVPVLVLTRHTEEVYARRALQAGAQGFLEKGTDPGHVLDATRHLADGELVVPEALRDRILHQFSQAGPKNNQSLISQLTDREFEVFELLGRGETAHEIADTLEVSPKTVHTYRQRIKNKLEIGSSAELLRVAVMWTEGGL